MKKLLLFGLMTCAIAGLHAEPSATNQSLENTKVELPSKKRVAARLVLQTVVPFTPFFAVKGCGIFKGCLSDDDKENTILISGGITLFGWVELFNQNVKDSYAIAKSCMNADQTESRVARYTKKVGAGIAALATASLPALITYATYNNKQICDFLFKLTK